MIIVYYLILVLVVVALIRTTRYAIDHYRTYRLLRNIPGPQFRFPLWGNLGLFNAILRHREPSKEFLDMMAQMSARYDPDGRYGVIRLWLGPFMPIVVVTNAAIAQKLLNSKDHLDKATFYGLFRFAIFDGIFTCKTEQWRVHKRELQEHLKPKALRTYIGNTENQLAILNEKIETCIRQNFGLVDDLKPLISTFVLDVLGQNLFSTEFHSQQMGEPEFVCAVHHMLAFSYLAFLRPYTYFFTNPVMKYLVSLPTIRDTLMLIINFRKSVRKIIIGRYKRITDTGRSKETPPPPLPRAAAAAAAVSGYQRVTMLDAMIRVRMSEQDKRIRSMKDIEAQMNTFVIAGHDTTTSSLSWAVYLLAHHQDQQRQAREEVDNYLRHLETALEPVTLSNLRRLKYLECCINESLRLYPSGPFIGRRARADLFLDNGTILPGRINYIVYIEHMHKNPKYFHEPERFYPERFLLQQQQQQQPTDTVVWATNSAFMPFAGGLRMCLGKEYGIMQQKLFLVNLLARYRIEPVDQYGECRPTYNFLLSPGHFPIRFVPRQQYHHNRTNRSATATVAAVPATSQPQHRSL